MIGSKDKAGDWNMSRDLRIWRSIGIFGILALSACTRVEGVSKPVRDPDDAVVINKYPTVVVPVYTPPPANEPVPTDDNRCESDHAAREQHHAEVMACHGRKVAYKSWVNENCTWRDDGTASTVKYQDAHGEFHWRTVTPALDRVCPKGAPPDPTPESCSVISDSERRKNSDCGDVDL